MILMGMIEMIMVLLVVMMDNVVLVMDGEGDGCRGC